MRRARNRGQNAANTSHDGVRGGPSPDKSRGGGRSNLASGNHTNIPIDRWEHDRFPRRPGRQEHAAQGGNHYDQRAQRGAPAGVVGYGPNSRYGYRDSKRAQGHAQPQADWGNARRSDWQQDGRQAPPGVRMHGDAHQHSGVQHAAPMHPPPDQIAFQQGQQAMQAPVVIRSPQVLVNRQPTMTAHAPPPDVQLRPSPINENPRAVNAHQQDWRMHQGRRPDAVNRGSMGHRAYRGQDGRQINPNGRPRCHRWY